MKLQLDSGSAQYLIHGYCDESVTINGRELRASFILSPDALVEDWFPQAVRQLAREHVEQIILHQPEVVILGTGLRTQFPSADVMKPLLAAAIGYEVMDTRAACRCYAVMVSEGRRVVAAMLPPCAE